MNPKPNRRMMEVLDELDFRDDVGVLVLTRERSAWSAGMDLKEYFRDTEAQGLAELRKAQRESYRWWRRLRWYQEPTIAMLFYPALCDRPIRVRLMGWALPIR